MEKEVKEENHELIEFNKLNKTFLTSDAFKWKRGISDEHLIECKLSIIL